jgi:hypothetical protein
MDDTAAIHHQAFAFHKRYISNKIDGCRYTRPENVSDPVIGQTELHAGFRI